jgi:predicted O-methyltransferase YrrM
MSIFEQVDQYIYDRFAKEDEALKNTITSLDTYGIPQISVSATQGKFLYVMAKLCRAQRILELGTLGGYSTIWMARAMADTGKLISVEYESKHAEVATKNIDAAGQLHKVEIRIGKGIDVLQKMIDEGEKPFDLIFIDADKPPYAEYFELALQLSRPGTLIICDNVIRDGKVVDENTDDDMVRGVQRLAKLLSETDKADSTIMATVGVKEFDGMSISVVK